MTESTANITVRRRVNGLPPTQTLPAREIPAASIAIDPAASAAMIEAEQAQAELSESDSALADPELPPINIADEPAVAPAEAPVQAAPVQVKAVWKVAKPRVAKAAKPKTATVKVKAKGKAGRKPSLDEAHAAKLKKLLAGGASLTKVAAIFKISVPTAKRYATKLGFTDVAVKHKPGRKSSTKAKAAPKAKLKAFVKNPTRAKASPRKEATAEKFNARRFAKEFARAVKAWADEVE